MANVEAPCRLSAWTDPFGKFWQVRILMGAVANGVKWSDAGFAWLTARQSLQIYTLFPRQAEALNAGLIPEPCRTSTNIDLGDTRKVDDRLFEIIGRGRHIDPLHLSAANPASLD